MTKLRAYFRDLRLVLSYVRNPVRLILDRLGLQKEPYVVQHKTGLLFELRPRMGDRFGFYEVMLRGDYTDHGQVLEPGGVVVDIGANVGCFTILAANLVGPHGRVLAFEPDEMAFRQLQRNVALNGLNNVSTYQAAVGAREGSAKFFVSEESSLFSSMSEYIGERRQSGTVLDVQLTTLEATMQKEGLDRLDYLKLDCEGGEYDILGSMTTKLASCIAQVCMEAHEIPDHKPQELLDRLQELHFKQISRENVYYYRLRDEE